MKHRAKTDLNCSPKIQLSCSREYRSVEARTQTMRLTIMPKVVLDQAPVFRVIQHVTNRARIKFRAALRAYPAKFKEFAMARSECPSCRIRAICLRISAS